MEYKVVKQFSDAQDNYHIYNVGDVYPRMGLVVAKNRIESLASADNAAKEVFIVEVRAKDAEQVEDADFVEQKKARKTKSKMKE